MTGLRMTSRRSSSVLIFDICYMKKFNTIFCIATSTIILGSCKTYNAEAEKNSSLREHSVQSVLWQQTAGEYRALCYQAYNMAQHQLEECIANNPTNQRLAIITDLDETVLDNSPYNAMMIEKDVEYSSDTWKEWGERIAANPVPGAVEFFKQAEAMSVEVFYISNRVENQLEETMKNMELLGMPYLDEDHFFLKTTTSGKEERRQMISDEFRIIMLMGDNLSDFNQVFDKKGTAERNTLADSLQVEFGRKYIVFPNVMYGDWETKGVYEGKYDWTAEEKDFLRKSKIQGYEYMSKKNSSKN